MPVNEELYVVGILVGERARNGPEVQDVLTRYGSSILSRNGIPDPSKKRGIITVTLQAPQGHAAKLKHDLDAIEGVASQFVTLGTAD